MNHTLLLKILKILEITKNIQMIHLMMMKQVWDTA